MYFLHRQHNPNLSSSTITASAQYFKKIYEKSMFSECISKDTMSAMPVSFWVAMPAVDEFTLDVLFLDPTVSRCNAVITIVYMASS